MPVWSWEQDGWNGSWWCTVTTRANREGWYGKEGGGMLHERESGWIGLFCSQEVYIKLDASDQNWVNWWKIVEWTSDSSEVVGSTHKKKDKISKQLCKYIFKYK